MRIISGFHDYYDGVRKYGVDPKLVYVRERRELFDVPVPPELNAILKQIPSHFDGVGYWPFNRGVVCFCGRVYPFVACYDSFCYTIDDFVEVWKRGRVMTEDVRIRTNVIKRMLDPAAYDGLPRRHRAKGYVNQSAVSVLSWRALLALDLSVSDDLHRRFESPVFLVSNTLGLGGRFGIVVNPVLRDLMFYWQVPVVDAYQRLAMYVGNNMVTQKDPNVGLTDVMRRDTAGFDNWSFKKHRDDPKPARAKR
jgi:hypothetical protein